MVIPQKQLRNEISDVLRRAEAGEVLTITVSGRPVAELGPVRGRRWVDSAAVRELWELPPDRGLAEVVDAFSGGLRDPWQR